MFERKLCRFGGSVGFVIERSISVCESREVVLWWRRLVGFLSCGSDSLVFGCTEFFGLLLLEVVVYLLKKRAVLLAGSVVTLAICTDRWGRAFASGGGMGFATVCANWLAATEFVCVTE